MRSHFELFDLDPAYAIDTAALDQSYRDLQALVHPDRYASAGDAERRASMQLTTRVNEAYRALKDPVDDAVREIRQAWDDQVRKSKKREKDERREKTTEPKSPPPRPVNQ